MRKRPSHGCGKHPRGWRCERRGEALPAVRNALIVSYGNFKPAFDDDTFILDHRMTFEAVPLDPRLRPNLDLIEAAALSSDRKTLEEYAGEVKAEVIIGATGSHKQSEEVGGGTKKILTLTYLTGGLEIVQTNKQ